VKGRVREGNKRATVNIQGTLVCESDIDVAKSGSALNVTWTPDDSWFLDITGAATNEPYTILRWEEE
jgi:hypothetical protein